VDLESLVMALTAVQGLDEVRARSVAELSFFRKSLRIRALGTLLSADLLELRVDDISILSLCGSSSKFQNLTKTRAEKGKTGQNRLETLGF